MDHINSQKQIAKRSNVTRKLLTTYGVRAQDANILLAMEGKEKM